jgi:hypothetical protein
VLFDVLQEIPLLQVLHDHVEIDVIFDNFEEPDNIAMMEGLEDSNFFVDHFNLLFGFESLLGNGLNGNVFLSGLMNTQLDFPKSASS